MKTNDYSVNAAETENAASIMKGLAGYLSDVKYSGYCAGTYRDYIGNDITIVFRCDYLELTMVPFSSAIYGDNPCSVTSTYCQYYKDCKYSLDSVSISLFRGEELREIVDDFILCRAEAMDYVENEEVDNVNSFGYPYYRSVKGEKHIFHLEDDYGDCAVIENR